MGERRKRIYSYVIHQITYDYLADSIILISVSIRLPIAIRLAQNVNHETPDIGRVAFMAHARFFAADMTNDF